MAERYQMERAHVTRGWQLGRFTPAASQLRGALALSAVRNVECHAHVREAAFDVTVLLTAAERHRQNCVL